MSDLAAAADGDAPDSGNNVTVVNVADDGDIVLDVTFETSTDTLKKARKAALAASRKTGIQPPPSSTLKPKIRVAYRVKLEALKKNSKYFATLLSNAQFCEAQLIADTHSKLALYNIKPKDVKPQDLPWISITDDDEATKASGREHAFEDILKIIHQKPPKDSKVTMSYVTTMAILADRFDCVSAVSRALTNDMKFKWPLTANKPLYDDKGQLTEVEQVLRQKVLVAWLLGQPMRLHAASRELVIRGSKLWSAFQDADSDMTAAWWTLPDGLEHELQYRRESILNAISSVQKHFLNLYSSRERQCKLGYDSSAACDSFQLGQMLKFFMSKSLCFLVDFSPQSLEDVPDCSMLDIDELLTNLKQCPNYQVDRYHTNCGLRIRIDPIIDYIRSALSANVISIAHADWKQRRIEVSWVVSKEERLLDESGKKFEFTRSLANDQRLRSESMHSERLARNMFTADVWDWTPEV